MGSKIPGILPPHIQFELAEEMSRHGYDASGETVDMGWDAFSAYCRDNPGTCQRFDDIQKQLETNGNSPIEKLDQALEDGIDWINNAKGNLLSVFDKKGYDPDNQEIYDNRQDIKMDFLSQYIRADLHGEKMDPLVAERMEQLIELHPDEADSRYHSAMDKVIAEPEKFGLETDKPGMFSNNEGMVFTPN